MLFMTSMPRQEQIRGIQSTKVMWFALLAGGLAGSVTVAVLKYVVKEVGWPTMWFGVGNVVGNGCVMMRFVLIPE